MKRRLARLEFVPEFVQRIGSGYFRVIADRLPSDCAIWDSYFESARGTFGIVFESETFAEIEEGATIPFLEGPRVERLDSKIMDAISNLAGSDG